MRNLGPSSRGTYGAHRISWVGTLAQRRCHLHSGRRRVRVPGNGAWRVQSAYRRLGHVQLSVRGANAARGRHGAAAEASRRCDRWERWRMLRRSRCANRSSGHSKWNCQIANTSTPTNRPGTASSGNWKAGTTCGPDSSRNPEVRTVPRTRANLVALRVVHRPAAS